MSVIGSLLPAAFLFAAMALHGPVAEHGRQDRPVAPAVTDSAAAAFRAATRRLTSPEFELRKATRLEFQQRGYASILHEVLRRNALGAFLAMIKSKAQLDLHLPSNTLVVTVPINAPPRGDPRFEIFSAPSTPPLQFPLVEDRRFPENPWKK